MRLIDKDKLMEILCQHCDSHIEMCEDCGMKEIIESVPSAWIKCSERLPEDGEFVLVCNDDGHMMIAKHETETFEWYYKYTNYDFDVWDNDEQGPVLYWMPLPDALEVAEKRIDELENDKTNLEAEIINLEIALDKAHCELVRRKDENVTDCHTLEEGER